VSGEDARRGITRLDQASVSTHGWQVRLQRRGVRFARFFSDAGWGGREAALEKATRFRDRLLARIEREGDASPASSGSHRLPATRNRSGSVGVARIVQRGPNGVEYFFWQAFWTDAEGRRVSLRFSVQRHGEESAYLLALEARRAAMGRR